MGELMGVGPIGQPLTPLAAGLSPCDMVLYVKHVKAYTAQITPTSAVPSSGRGRAGRAPLRSSRSSPRTGRAAPLRAPVSPKLTVIDAESRARAQLAMWAAPLMSDVIPPGGLILHRPSCRHSWPSLQNSWAPIIVRILRKQMRQTWTRDLAREQSHSLCPAPFMSDDSLVTLTSVLALILAFLRRRSQHQIMSSTMPPQYPFGVLVLLRHGLPRLIHPGSRYMKITCIRSPLTGFPLVRHWLLRPLLRIAIIRPIMLVCWRSALFPGSLVHL